MREIFRYHGDWLYIGVVRGNGAVWGVERGEGDGFQKPPDGIMEYAEK